MTTFESQLARELVDAEGQAKPTSLHDDLVAYQVQIENEQAAHASAAELQQSTQGE